MNQKATGFASPAQGYEDGAIDLNGLLVKNPPATYFFWLESDDMAGMGLPRGALLVVDRSMEARPDSFVIIAHEGQFLCRLMVENGGFTVFTNGMTDIMPVVDETQIIGTVRALVKCYDNAH
jgi:DNA polymerase V